jgi:hypothetical protein
MTKQVYICGDSFGVSDPEYGKCWVDLLAEIYSVTNLSKVCATNSMISQQVDLAISANPDFIIGLGTSSTRQLVKFNNTVVPFSIYSIDDTTKFSKHQRDILKQYVSEFFDITTAVYENKCVIENTLQKLVDSTISFRFDQGGFEHPNFNGSKIGYFKKYKNYLSAINLWSYTTARPHRPYYHITDISTHKDIANYYINEINKT